MKRIFIALCAICPLFAHADIIATFSNGNIEDVTVVSIGAEEVVYNEGGTQKSIVSSQVEGVLYDDGRFVAPPKKVTVADSFESIPDDSWAVDDAITDDSQTASSNRRQKREKKEHTGDKPSFDDVLKMNVDGNITKFNVYAFGKYIKLYYLTDHNYDGTKVEYRVIYKEQTEQPEWQYLGTSPFCYITPVGGINPVYISKDAKKIAEVRPLEIENFTQVKKVEFRLSKEGYQTVVVSPLFQVDFTGLYYFISLNKLKPGNDAITPPSSKESDNSQSSEDGW